MSTSNCWAGRGRPVTHWVAQLCVVLLLVGVVAVGESAVMPDVAEASSTVVEVPSNMNIFGAGLACGPGESEECPHPGGECPTSESWCDGPQGGDDPVEASIPSGTTYITFDSTQANSTRVGHTKAVSGQTYGCATFWNTGTIGSTFVNGTGGISGIVAPGGAMLHVGVFLGSEQPSDAPPPNYYSQLGNYVVDAPQLGQLFYVGTGDDLTTGRQHKIVVPEGAESVYFGWAMAPPVDVSGTVAVVGDPGWYAANKDTWDSTNCQSNPTVDGPLEGTVSFETGPINDPIEDPERGSPSQSGCCQASAADPVDTESGMFTHVENDIVIPGRAPVLELSRAYRSLNAGTAGPFGDGWTYNYGIELLEDTPEAGVVTIREENGSEITFVESSTGGWSPEFSRTLATLTYHSGSAEWTFTRNRQDIFVFDTGGTLIALQSLAAAAAGESTTVEHFSGQMEVTDLGGRTLTFVFDSTHTDRVASVTDPAGRQMTFTYDSGGDYLLSATDVRGQTTSYCYNVSPATTGCPAYDSGQPADLLTQMKDPRGNTVTNTYDSSGRVIDQVDRAGQTISFDYAASSDSNCSASGGTITTTKITFPDSSDGNPDLRLDTFQDGALVCQTRTGSGTTDSTWSYTYDPVTDRWRTATDPNGHTTTSYFDRWGNLTERIDPLGRSQLINWNRYNQPVSTTDADDATTSFTYHSTYGFLNTKISRPLVGTSDVSETEMSYTTTTNHRFGDLESITDPNGEVWSYTYDTAGADLGYMTAITDPLDNTTTYSTDIVGRPTSRTTPKGNEGSVDVQYRTMSTFDTGGLAAAWIQNTETVLADSFGRAPSTSSLGSADSGESWTADAGTWGLSGATGYLQSGSAGQATIDGGPDGGVGFMLPTPRDGEGVVFRHSDTDNYWRVTADVTNSRWQLVEVTNGSVTQTINSASGTCCDSTDLNFALFDGNSVAFGTIAHGVLISGTDNNHQTSSGVGLYSATAQTGVTGSAGIANFLFQEFESLLGTDRVAAFQFNSYDPNGNVAYTQGEANNRTAFTYDGENRPTVIERPDTSTIENTYYDNGLLESQIDGAGAATTYEYDHVRRNTLVTDPAGRSAAFDYDPGGRVIRRRTPENSTACNPAATFSYDDANQLTQIRYGTFTGTGCDENYTADSNTPDVIYTYSDLGERTSMTDGEGVACYVWDSLGRMTTYLFDAEDCDDPGGDAVSTSYGYDLKGQLTELTYPDQTTPVTRVFDEAGRITQITDFNSTVSYWDYDANSNLVCMAVGANNCTSTGTPTMQVDYHYNVFDELVDDTSTAAISVEADGSAVATYEYSRNTRGLVKAHTATVETVQTVDETYPYDDLSRIEGVDSADYGYDTADNIDELWYGSTLSYANDPGFTCPPTCTGKANIPYQRFDDTPTLQNTYAYDTNGRRIENDVEGGNTIDYTWNKANRLIGRTNPNGTLRYNGDGLRTYEASGFVPIDFDWDPNTAIPQMLRARVTNQITLNYIYGPDGVAFTEIYEDTNGESTRYYAHDQIGSIRLVVDDTGTVDGNVDYDPYGRVTNLDGNAPLGIGYTGEWTRSDPEGDLIYLRNRWYDTETAQFLSRDGLTSATRSPYGYAANNPLTYTDPTGNIPLLVPAIIGGLIGGVTSAASQNISGDINLVEVAINAGIGALLGPLAATNPISTGVASGAASSYFTQAYYGNGINTFEVILSGVLGGVFGYIAHKGNAPPGPLHDAIDYILSIGGGIGSPHLADFLIEEANFEDFVKNQLESSAGAMVIC